MIDNILVNHVSLRDHSPPYDIPGHCGDGLVQDILQIRHADDKVPEQETVIFHEV